MTTARALSVFLIALVTTATAAPDKAVDPSTIKEKVSIPLGKTLYVRFEQKGNMLSDAKVVEKPVDSTPAVRFDFVKKGDNLILATENPFSKNLKFRALARHQGREDYFETSIVPVFAKLSSLELWQDPIEELVLFDFQLVGETP